MKKQLLVVALSVALFPLAASADLIGQGNLSVSGGGNSATVTFSPGIGTVTAQLDYQASSTTIGSFVAAAGYTGFTLDTIEVYCVEGATLTAAQPYQFFSYQNSLEGQYTSAVWQEATWIANYGLSSNANKELVQKSLWELIAGGNVASFDYSTSTLHTQYSNAGETQDDFVNDWFLAVNPVGSLGQVQSSQNFLVKGTASPVPEPATMLLFGTGLAGLAGIARRKRS